MREFYQNHKNKLIWIASVLVTAFIVVAIFGASENNSGYGGVGITNSAVSSDSMMGAFAESLGVSFKQRGLPILPPSPDLPSVQPGDISDKKVIRNASLSLVVNKIDDAISGIKSIVDGVGGFVQNSSVYDTGDNKKGGDITVRVPSKNFDESIGAIKNLAIKVSREDVNARDVTEQFVDMQVRIKNMKAEETQYVDILKRAETIEEILNVTERLADVRTRIESTEGQLNYLSQQVDMSTISISLLSEADVEVFGVVWSPLAEIKQGVRNMLQSIVDVINKIIAFVFKLPSIILWLIILAIVVKFGMKIYRAVRVKYLNNNNSV